MTKPADDNVSTLKIRFDVEGRARHLPLERQRLVWLAARRELERQEAEIARDQSSR